MQTKHGIFADKQIVVTWLRDLNHNPIKVPNKLKCCNVVDYYPDQLFFSRFVEDFCSISLISSFSYTLFSNFIFRLSKHVKWISLSTLSFVLKVCTIEFIYLFLVYNLISSCLFIYYIVNTYIFLMIFLWKVWKNPDPKVLMSFCIHEKKLNLCKTWIMSVYLIITGWARTNPVLPMDCEEFVISLLRYLHTFIFFIFIL